MTPKEAINAMVNNAARCASDWDPVSVIFKGDKFQYSNGEDVDIGSFLTANNLRIIKSVKKVALYAYTYDGLDWKQTYHYYESDEQLRKDVSEVMTFKRLDYTEIEVES